MSTVSDRARRAASLMSFRPAHALGLALLALVAVPARTASASTDPPPPAASESLAFTSGRLTLDDFAYSPGSVPTICFTVVGVPRQAAFLYKEFPVYLEFAEVPGATSNTSFPPYFMGTVETFSQIEIQLDPVTCNSVDQYIQGFGVDPVTGEKIAITNEVHLVIDKSSCDPNMTVGGEGCTAWAWRNFIDPADWPIPLTPDTQFGSIFEDAFPTETLGEVLDGFASPLEIFARQAVAALLNAQSPAVNYDLSVSEVIAKFDDTYPGTDAEYFDAAVELFVLNIQGCGLTDSTDGTRTR